MVEFVVSLLVAGLSLGVYHLYAARVAVDKQMTWGEAMIAALYVFFIFFWVYGVVPHYWLEWADKGLGWRADRFVHGPGGILRDQNSGGWMPFTITYLVLRDIIAVTIYVVFLGANIGYWHHWQSRAARAQAKQQAVEIPSEFGRPLVREGAR
jgi:hypothetical protein